MIQEREIYDYATIGKRLFEDSSLRSTGPLVYFEDRATGIFGCPNRLTPNAIPRESVRLFMKWPLGAKPDAAGDVLFDMSASTPATWIDELPRTVTAMRYLYRDVGIYLGCVRNATLAQIRHVMYYVVEACQFGFVGLDAAGLITPGDAGGRPNPNWGKVLWIKDVCNRAGVPVYFEPVVLLDQLSDGSTLPGGSIQEEDHERHRFGLANVISKPKDRALPPRHRVIAAQQSFNARHFDARVEAGFDIAANFANPEVRAWYLGHLARQEEERHVRDDSAMPKAGPAPSQR